jgi:hypothetical protein
MRLASEIQRNFVNNRVLRPEESVVILGTADPALRCDPAPRPLNCSSACLRMTA